MVILEVLHCVTIFFLLFHTKWPRSGVTFADVMVVRFYLHQFHMVGKGGGHPKTIFIEDNSFNNSALWLLLSMFLCNRLGVYQLVGSGIIINYYHNYIYLYPIGCVLFIKRGSNHHFWLRFRGAINKLHNNA